MGAISASPHRPGAPRVAPVFAVTAVAASLALAGLVVGAGERPETEAVRPAAGHRSVGEAIPTRTGAVAVTGFQDLSKVRLPGRATPVRGGVLRGTVPVAASVVVANRLSTPERLSFRRFRLVALRGRWRTVVPTDTSSSERFATIAPGSAMTATLQFSPPRRSRLLLEYSEPGRPVAVVDLRSRSGAGLRGPRILTGHVH